MEGDRKEDSCAPQRARGQQQQVADGGLAQDGHGRRGSYGERREGCAGLPAGRHERVEELRDVNRRARRGRIEEGGIELPKAGAEVEDAHLKADGVAKAVRRRCEQKEENDGNVGLRAPILRIPREGHFGEPPARDGKGVREDDGGFALRCV